MGLAIPISKFQRQTKDAFEEATSNGYKYVMSHNDEIAVVVEPYIFQKMQEAYNREEKSSGTKKRMHIDEFRGYFGKSDMTGLQLQKEALKLWMKD